MTVQTTSAYWDCECDTNYIHSSIECDECPECGAFYAEQPDSIIGEAENSSNHCNCEA